MDDRFDRRELLLHVGDMLDVLSCLARTNEPGARVTHVALGNDALQKYAFLPALSPKMTVSAFTQRIASTFSGWPALLLETELNRDALASTVQLALFADQPDGWNAYVAYMQKTVKWFGHGLPEIRSAAEPLHDAVEKVTPVSAAPSPQRDMSRERKGWPWPDPKTTG